MITFFVFLILMLAIEGAFPGFLKGAGNVLFATVDVAFKLTIIVFVLILLAGVVMVL